MSLTDIMQTLEQQTGLYEQLLNTAKEKTPVLIHNEVEQLNGLVQRERKLIAEAEKLEQARILHTHRYFSSLGYISRMNTLRELIRAVNQPEEKQQLLNKQQELQAVLGELKRNNDLNQQLIQQSLAFINYSIDLVVDDPTEDLVYQHPQKGQAGNSRNGIFDTRA